MTETLLLDAAGGYDDDNYDDFKGEKQGTKKMYLKVM